MADATMDSNETLDADGMLRRSVLKAVAAVPLLASMAARARADEPPVPQQPASSIFVRHAYDEQQVDLGEVVMNYATVGSPGKPALVLIPPQTRSWWNFEAAMTRLAPDLQVFAVDLRGQDRSTRTPGRYTLDSMGNLVRFVDLVIKGPSSPAVDRPAACCRLGCRPMRLQTCFEMPKPARQLIPTSIVSAACAVPLRLQVAGR